MRVVVRFSLAALLAAIVASPALAQDVLAKRVSLDLKGMAPAEAFKVLGDAIGVGITVDTSLKAPVDIVVRNVRARTALDTICDSIDCKWTRTAGGIDVKPGGQGTSAGATGRGSSKGDPEAEQVNQRLREGLKKPLSGELKFQGTPLPEVMDRMSQASDGLRITASGKDVAARTITADFTGQSLMAAIQKVGEQVGPGTDLSFQVSVSGHDRPVVMLKMTTRPAPTAAKQAPK